MYLQYQVKYRNYHDAVKHILVSVLQLSLCVFQISPSFRQTVDTLHIKTPIFMRAPNSVTSDREHNHLQISPVRNAEFPKAAPCSLDWLHSSYLPKPTYASTMSTFLDFENSAELPAGRLVLVEVVACFPP